MLHKFCIKLYFQFQLIFKISKHSNILSPIQSSDQMENEQPAWDHGEMSTTIMDKRIEVKN